MSGWRTQIDGEYEPPTGVVAVIVAQKFSAPEVIRTVLEDGFSRVAPDTVWVLREAERKGHAVNFAWQTFRSNGITPLLAPLVPAWKGEDYDLRASWRDSEIRATVERIVVFHDKSSNVTAEWGDYAAGGKDEHLCSAKIYVVERGKVKIKKYRKGRKID